MKKKKSDSLNSSVESEDLGSDLKGQMRVVGNYGKSKFGQAYKIYDKKGIAPTLPAAMGIGGGYIPALDVSGQMTLTNTLVKLTEQDSETKSLSKEMSEISEQSKFLSLIFLQQDFPVKVFPLLENAKVFRIEQGELFSSRSAGSLEIKDQATYSLRMLKDYFHTMEAEPSQLYSFHWMNLGMMRNGKCLTLNIGCPKTGKGSLSLVLEGEVDKKYYLSKQVWEKIKAHKKRHEEKGHGFGFVMKEKNDTASTLTSIEASLNANLIAAQAPQLQRNIRRLTPIECERLQGFPDNWTKGVSDTQRYKQMGNSVSIPVITAIGKKILEVLE